MGEVHVLFKFGKNPYGGVEVDTTSGSGDFRELSPFILDARKYGSKNFENLWQFSKVYKRHVAEHGNPTVDWFRWRDAGWSLDRAVRYPMGKGAVPEYSFWATGPGGYWGRLDYIEARKRIYVPIYAELVQETDSFKRLQQLYLDNPFITLRDYDAYDHIKIGKTLKQVINDPSRKCGHAFVLAMILTGVLQECIEQPEEEPNGLI